MNTYIQVQAELLPFAQGERAIDDLESAEVEHRGLTKIGDQEDHREQERKDARDFQLLGEDRVGGRAEAGLFFWLTGEGFDHLQPGDVFLQHRVQRTEADLGSHKQGLGDPAEKQEHGERDRQNRQDHQRQRYVGEPQHHQRGDEQHHRLQRHHQALPDEEPDLLDVVGGADHQLAGLVAVVVAERQPLDLGEQLVAEIEGDVLRDALRVVLLAEREYGSHDAEHDNREHGAYERLGRAALAGASAHDGIDDVLNELGYDKLCSGSDKQRAIGEKRQPTVATDVAHGSHQHPKARTRLTAASSLSAARFGGRHRGIMLVIVRRRGPFLNCLQRA